MSMQRPKHVSSLKHLELESLVVSLTQHQNLRPESRQSPLDTLQNMNNVAKLPGWGRVNPSDRLRTQSVKVQCAAQHTSVAFEKNTACKMSLSFIWPQEIASLHACANTAYIV